MRIDRTENGIKITPLPDDAERARELLESGHHPDTNLCDMLDEFLCNGWMMIPPEAIGALTDAPILSEDFTLNDDSEYEAIAPEPVVYAHMNYAVEDPVETWAAGKPVFWVKAVCEQK